MTEQPEVVHEGRPFLASGIRDDSVRPVPLRALVESGRVRRIFRGVYVDAATPDTRELRAAALHLVRPSDAVFYGTTAAFVMGVEAFPPGRRFDFTPQCVVPHHQSRCRLPGVECHEGYLDGDDVTEFAGLLLTTPTRTAVDLLRSLWRPYALAAVDLLAHSGLIVPGEVRARVATMRRYPGIVQARTLCRLIDPDAESPGETWTRLRLVDAGLPVPESQVVVLDRYGGFLARLDHGYRAQRVGIEFDGREFHDDDRAQEADAGKRRYLVDALGWRLSVVRRESILGDDPAFERQIGEWLGVVPRSRSW